MQLNSNRWGFKMLEFIARNKSLQAYFALMLIIWKLPDVLQAMAALLAVK